MHLYDNMVNELDTKKSSLVLKANKTALNSLISEVEALDLTKYTQTSVSALSEKLTLAKELAANLEATQTDVDSMVSELTALKEALELIPEPAKDNGCGGSVIASIFGLISLASATLLLAKCKREE